MTTTCSAYQSLCNHYPNLNKVWLSDRKGICSTDIYVITPKVDKVEPTLYSYIFRDRRFNDQVMSQVKGAQLPRIGWKSFAGIKIPLPPLEVQQEIVAEIEGYQKVIDGARAVVENYRPHIHVDPEWPMVEIGVLCERIQYGLSFRLNTENRGYRTFRMSELVRGKCIDHGNMKCAEISADDYEKYKLERGDILFNRTNSIEHVGRTGIFDLIGKYCFASYLIRLTVSEEIANPFYVNAFMNTDEFQSGIKQYASRAIGQANINAKSLAGHRIPLPPLKTQQTIVAEIEAEQTLVNASRELIGRFEKKIRDAIARVWRQDRAEAESIRKADD